MSETTFPNSYWVVLPPAECRATLGSSPSIMSFLFFIRSSMSVKSLNADLAFARTLSAVSSSAKKTDVLPALAFLYRNSKDRRVLPAPGPPASMT